MKLKQKIILAAILMSAAAYSQNSQTNKDSIDVSVQDMDKASIKMIERKMYYDQWTASSRALDACDSLTNTLKGNNRSLEAISSDLRNVISNQGKTIADLKIVSENEKTAKLRRGFIGFVVGVLIGGSVVLLSK